MNENNLDSFTMGLIERTEKRNRFLEEVNLNITKDNASDSIKVPLRSNLSEKSIDLVSVSPVNRKKRKSMPEENTDRLKAVDSDPCSLSVSAVNSMDSKDLHRAEPVKVVGVSEKSNFTTSQVKKSWDEPSGNKDRASQRPKFGNNEDTSRPLKPVSSPVDKKERTMKVGNYKADDSDPCLLPLSARLALFERQIKRANPANNKAAVVLTDDHSTSPSSTSDSDQNPSTDLEELIEINNAPVEISVIENCFVDDVNVDSDADNSLGSNASSLLSNIEENGIIQSTRIYPELPPLDDLGQESAISKESSTEEICLLSPIKSYPSSSPPLSPPSSHSSSSNPSPLPSPSHSHSFHASPQDRPLPNSPEKVEKIELPFTKPCPPPPPEVAPCTSEKPVMPLRTLSMYRREQKVRKHVGKVADDEDEDELSKDLEIEARKRELAISYAEEKSRKIEDLKIEADKYNKIIYQSFRALDHCVQTNNNSERIEAEKILLINVLKKNACVDELYRLQQEEQESIDLTDYPVGKMTFNKLTLLVKGDFFVSQAQCHDNYDYHFICLFTCGDKVLSTEALSSVDAIQEASLNFTNKTVFDQLKKDFKIRLDVYALALPKNKKRHHEIKMGSMGIRLTPKSKCKVKYTHSPALKASPGNEKIKCNFKRIGYLIFKHENISKSRFDLCNFMYTSPLENQIIIDRKTECQYSIKYSSYLNFHDQSGDFPVWNRRWCVLDGPFIHYWRFSEDEGDKQPLGTINLRLCVNPTITKASSDVCMRPHSFLFITLERKDNTLIPIKYLLAADIRREINDWLEVLNKVVHSIRLWEKDALQPLDQYSLDRVMK